MKFLDFGHITFNDAESQVDAIALNWGDGGDYLDTVQALVNVLALELLLSLVGQRLVKGLAVGDAGFAKRFLEHFLVEFLGPEKIHLGHGGSFFNNHYQHVAADFKPHILEQAQSEQRTNSR